MLPGCAAPVRNRDVAPSQCAIPSPKRATPGLRSLANSIQKNWMVAHNPSMVCARFTSSTRTSMISPCSQRLFGSGNEVWFGEAIGALLL